MPLVRGIFFMYKAKVVSDHLHDKIKALRAIRKSLWCHQNNSAFLKGKGGIKYG